MEVSVFRNFWDKQPVASTLEAMVEAIRSDARTKELVQDHFRVPAEGEAGEFVSVANALQIVSGSISQKLSPVHMGRAFRELGFQQRVVKNVRGYIVVRYTPQEMYSNTVNTVLFENLTRARAGTFNSIFIFLFSPI